jgi:hypothetical protein
MGYYVSITEAKFSIPANKIEEALATSLTCEGIQNSPTYYVSQIEHYEYLPPLIKLFMLVKKTWSFNLIIKDNSVVDIYFEAEKWHGNDVWFKAVASCIDAGSFVEMTGEDGEKWRYVFDGQYVVEKRPKVIWE